MIKQRYILSETHNSQGGITIKINDTMTRKNVNLRECRFQKVAQIHNYHRSLNIDDEIYVKAIQKFVYG